MLTKKDKKKRYNKKANTSSPHVFAWGDRYESQFTKTSANTAEEALSGSNLGGSIANVAGGIGGIVKAGMANAQIADTTQLEQEIEARENWKSSANDNDSLLDEMASNVSLRENISWEEVRGLSGGQLAGNTFKGIGSGAAAGAKVGGPWGAVAGAAVGLAGGLAGIFAGNRKAKEKAAQLNRAAKKANLAKAQTLTAKAGALDQAADARALAAYAANGGAINPFPSSEFGSPITEFNAGGSHEENPYDGIPQGIAPDGLPNLVEEGEVKYDNYIFSDRLMLNKNDKKKYKFLKGKTYADAAKAIKRELGIDERPNDLLAKTDLEEHLNILSMLQEEERAKRGLRGENRMMYKNGGHIFDGITPDPAHGDDFDWDIWDTGDNTGADMSYQEYTALHNDNGTTSGQPSKFSSFLQLAPVIGNGLGSLHQMFNTPDYKHAKELQNGEDKNITPITYTPLTQKMVYKPMDVNYYGNKLAAQAGSTRRAIREQTASNPYASTAALLSADANAQGQLGDLYKKAEEYNLAQREKVDTFNRATDSANAEMSMKAQQLNASLKDSRAKRQLERDSLAARLKMMEDQAYSEALSSSLTGLFDSLGEYGKGIESRKQAAAKIASEDKGYTPEVQNYVNSILSSNSNADTRKAKRQAKKLARKGYTI